ncbi:MAG: hypothetical protein QOG05_417 [Streptosporangiaceae bacterium]|nr:hypothetical protein [Streptosporangiaceae bacterium]
MTAVRSAGAPGHHLPPGQLPRLVAPGPPLGLQAHLGRYGPLPPGLAGPAGAGRLIAGVERAGLTGRGGAAFPVARKMRAVTGAARAGRGRRRGGPVLIANGAESEPASGKDAILLRQSPHLVLDGITLAAGAVGAARAYLCVDGADPGRAGGLLAAVAERQQAGLAGPEIRVVVVPGGYVASEESALVNFLNGGPAVPLYVPPRPFERGVGGQATLVNNVETLAHIALIARYGPDWFSTVGTRAAPGSALVTVGGAVTRPGVYEIGLGLPAGELIELAGGPAEPLQAILAGGYFGGWLPLPGAAPVPVSPPGLRSAGASFGTGVLIAVPSACCGLAETARVLRYLAGQSAGQCGPCTFGLPAIADALAHIAWQGRDERAGEWLRSLLPLVDKRGACHLPDGAAALVASTLRVFAGDLHEHLTRGPCPAAGRPPVLPVPRASGGQPPARAAIHRGGPP